MNFLDDDKRWNEWTTEFDEALAEFMGMKTTGLRSIMQLLRKFERVSRYCRLNATSTWQPRRLKSPGESLTGRGVVLPTWRAARTDCRRRNAHGLTI
jgi:hypothetical protein